MNMNKHLIHVSEQTAVHNNSCDNQYSTYLMAISTAAQFRT